MKKLLLASAVAALSVTAAQAAPTVYGKAFLTLDLNSGDTDITYYDNTKVSIEADDRSQLNSNSSRIGFKGSEPLTANNDLVYKLEYGINIDEDTDQFTAREAYMGIANKQYGTIVAGQLTPIDDTVNHANVLVGGVLGGDDVLTGSLSRVNNSFAYFSPAVNGIQFMGMYAMDENGNDTLGRDAFGIGANYEQAAMKAGVSYIRAGDELSTVRLSGAYDVNPALTLGAGVDLTDYDTDDNEIGLTLSGEMKTATPWIAYAQADVVSNVAGSDDGDAYRLAVGGKYAFNKATTGHLYGAYLNSDLNSTEKFGWEDDAGIEVKSIKGDGFGIGGGIEYKF